MKYYSVFMIIVWLYRVWKFWDLISWQKLIRSKNVLWLYEKFSTILFLKLKGRVREDVTEVEPLCQPKRIIFICTFISTGKVWGVCFVQTRLFFFFFKYQARLSVSVNKAIRLVAHCDWGLLTNIQMIYPDTWTKAPEKVYLKLNCWTTLNLFTLI
jgi:hypothetical protein